MSTATTTRPRPPARERGGTGPSAGDGRRAGVRNAVVSLVAVGVVAGGTWGVVAPRGGGHAGHGAGVAALATVDLADGTLRVDGLADKQVGHVMPGMSTPEDVPVGMRRFAVEVTLGADDDASMPYSRRDFTVSGPGVKPVTPVSGQFDSGTLAPGAAISGSLSFDVPKEATALSIRFRDTRGVALPALPVVNTTSPDGGHGAGSHGAEAQGAEGHGAAGSAKKPAGGAAPAPKAVDGHADSPGATAHEH